MHYRWIGWQANTRYTGRTPPGSARRVGARALAHKRQICAEPIATRASCACCTITKDLRAAGKKPSNSHCKQWCGRVLIRQCVDKERELRAVMGASAETKHESKRHLSGRHALGRGGISRHTEGMVTRRLWSFRTPVSLGAVAQKHNRGFRPIFHDFLMI